MATAMLETETGKKMLAEAMRRGDLAKQIFTDRTPFLNPDPWPLFVRYNGEDVTFVPRGLFYFSDPAGPSACLWIVPGSTR